MLMDTRFWFGALVGVGGVWAYHRYVRPIPTTKTA